MARIRLTAKARRRIGNLRNAKAALRSAGMPLLMAGNRAYFIGTDGQGVRFEMILVADDRNADDWTMIHAMPTRYRKNW